MNVKIGQEKPQDIAQTSRRVIIGILIGSIIGFSLGYMIRHYTVMSDANMTYQNYTIQLQEQFVKNEAALVEVIEEQNRQLKEIRRLIGFASNHQRVYQTKLGRLEYWMAAIGGYILPPEIINQLPRLPVIPPPPPQKIENAAELPPTPAIAEKPATKPGN